MAGSGGRGVHRSRQFLQRLRMRRALGIQSKGVLRSFKPMRGWDRRSGTWWDKKRNCIAIEGQDFAQDTQEGGADQFELIPDSDEEGSQQVSSFVAEDDEFVPETEPQDMPVVKHIGKQGATKTRGHLRTMFHEWRQILLESDKACTSQIGTSKEQDHKDDAKDDNEHKGSFSNVETDDEATPINVWEARGFLVLYTDDDHWNQWEDNDSDLLHKSFSFMKIEAMMSCTDGPSMDLDILIRCLVKEARQLLFSLWWQVQVWYGHGWGMVQVVLAKLWLLAFMDSWIRKMAPGAVV